MLILPAFKAYVRQHELFNTNDHILLAVSGGKDSVLMAHLFKLAGYQFSMAHCNFNLRAIEAERDEAFVKKFATEMEVPFHVIHFDTQKFAEEEKISTQMAARQLRYKWFEQLRKQHQYSYVALAQHQNDSIETLLINLVRGTGISGMHGILPKRDYLIRPMLFLSRQEVDHAITEYQIAYVEDSSNESSKYARNKLRLEVIPKLQEMNPNLTQTFAQNIIRFAQTEEVLNQVVAETRERLFEEENGFYHIQVSEILNLRPQQLLWFELLKPFHFTGTVVDEILNALTKQSGTSFYSATHRLTIDRQQVVISALAPAVNRFLNLHGQGEVELGNQKISLQLTDNLDFNSAKNIAHVDLELLIFPLTIRYRTPGDRFMPLGMKCFKKLSDFFIDRKISLPQKDHVPLLINGNGEMIWVVGLRQDERYKVGSTTKKVAIFELLNQ